MATLDFWVYPLKAHQGVSPEVAKWRGSYGAQHRVLRICLQAFFVVLRFYHACDIEQYKVFLLVVICKEQTEVIYMYRCC